MENSSRRPPLRRDRVVAPSFVIRHSARVVGRDWKNVAHHVVRRRVELGYKSTRQLARAVGITEKTIGRLEAGESVRSSTVAAVERQLQWAPGSAEAMLNGGQPIEASAPLDPLTVSRQQILEADFGQLLDLRAAIESFLAPHDDRLGISASAIADGWLRDAVRMQRDAQGGVDEREVG